MGDSYKTGTMKFDIFENHESAISIYYVQNMKSRYFPKIFFFHLGDLIEPFKQLVVTNCGKERPGSIVNEILKNGYYQIIL